MLAARFRVRYALERTRRLETNALSYLRDVDVLQLRPTGADEEKTTEVLAHANRQLEICRDRLDREQRYILDAVSALHQVAIRAAAELPTNPRLVGQVEQLLERALPRCPPPTVDVDSQLKIIEWLDHAIAAVLAAVQDEYLQHVDQLLEVVADDGPRS